MNSYTVKTGQNIYDVALTLYGSVEGIFDLLVSNDGISLDDELVKGQTLNWHEDFIINQDIVQQLENDGTLVKNGQNTYSDIDIKETIQNWVKTQNQNLRKLYVDGGLIVIKKLTTTQNDESGISTASIDSAVVSSAYPQVTRPTATSDTMVSGKLNAVLNTTGAAWTDQKISIGTLPTSDSSISAIEKIVNTNISQAANINIAGTMTAAYNNGFILVGNDEEAFYDSAATPKLLIKQNGSSSSIKMQIQAGSFIAVDWGDNSSLDFFHYSDDTVEAAHSYDDSGEHTILLYGVPQFTNLDLASACGIYYALSQIYVSGEFITPYKNAETLNKLFITNSSNE